MHGSMAVSFRVQGQEMLAEKDAGQVNFSLL